MQHHWHSQSSYSRPFVPLRSLFELFVCLLYSHNLIIPLTFGFHSFIHLFICRSSHFFVLFNIFMYFGIFGLFFRRRYPQLPICPVKVWGWFHSLELYVCSCLRIVCVRECTARVEPFIIANVFYNSQTKTCALWETTDGCDAVRVCLLRGEWENAETLYSRFFVSLVATLCCQGWIHYIHLWSS